MHIGVPLETHTGETRVAATPETIKKLIGQGHKVTVQAALALMPVLSTVLMKPQAQSLAAQLTPLALS